MEAVAQKENIRKKLETVKAIQNHFYRITKRLKGLHFMSQTFYFNGTILTMDNPLFADSVLSENGKIIAVGSYKDLQQMLSCNVTYFNLKGRTMIPAFLDTHSHFSAYANSLFQVPLETCRTKLEIIQHIRDFIVSRKIADGQWIVCKGYDHNLLPNGSHINRFDLDHASSSHPIVVQHQSGHLGIFNSAALALLHVTEQTPVPEGGVIEKKDGELTGYMEENAFLQFLQAVPMPPFSSLIKAFEEVQKRYASYGIATIQEGMMVDSLIPIYQYLLEHHLLKLDVIGYIDRQYKESFLSAFPSHWGQSKNHFKIGGYKIFLDGSPQGRTAWMRTPYLQTPDYCGYPSLNDEDVMDAVKNSVEDGLQILAHCNGDAACAQYLSCIKAAHTQGYSTDHIRPVMIHAQLLDYDQLNLVKSLPVIPSFFVAHVYHWGDTHIKNFGFARASRISPAASALRKKILFTFHQDTPVIEPDMLETIWCAVTRKTKDGKVLGEQEAISVLDALKAVTIHAAYQYFEEDKKGSITPGKNADFVILSQNPLEIPKQDLRSIQICHTIKDDRIIYSQI